MIESLWWVLGVNAVLWLWVWLVPVRVVRVRRLWKSGALGMALPGVIFVTPAGDHPGVLAHEMVHQKQFRRYSPFGASILLGWFYLSGAMRYRWQRGRWPQFWELWSSNPLEQEANEAMGKGPP